MYALKTHLYNNNFDDLILKKTELNSVNFLFPNHLKIKEINKQLNIKRTKLWLNINNLSTIYNFSDDISINIMSYIIDDIVKFSLRKLAMNNYYKIYYGNFSWLGDKCLWTCKETKIFYKEIESLKENDFIKSSLDDNDEYERLSQERGGFQLLRRSYNSISKELCHCRYHDRNGNCSQYENLLEYDREIADKISNRIRIMNNKELAGKIIVSFIRRVLDRS
jgi:hypothetical protein